VIDEAATADANGAGLGDVAAEDLEHEVLEKEQAA